jgi:hypothetical protein
LNKMLIRFINLLFPYSWLRPCAKCGRKWGNFVYHFTTESKYIVQLYSWPTTSPPNASSSLGLFCSHCDRLVTIQERWDALDAWKAHCINRVSRHDISNLQQVIENINSIEFLEFPRERKPFIGVAIGYRNSNHASEAERR